MATQRVKEILSWYRSDNPGTLTNLARLLGGLERAHVLAPRGAACPAAVMELFSAKS